MNRRHFLSLPAGAFAPPELRRTQPDYFAYVPRSTDGSTNDSHNEHFLVFDGPDGSLMAVWTQSSGLPGRGQQNRIMFSRSEDDGVTWAAPRRIAGPTTPEDPTYMASWCFPLLARSGRIYVIWNQNDGSKAWIQMHTGRMAACFSDDAGRTWSPQQFIEMPRSSYDDPEGRIPAEWIVWQLPMRDLKGGWFVGYSHWLHPARAYYKKVESWTQIESVVEFMRFENVDRDPQPRDLRIRYSAWDEKALRVPYFKDPLLSIAQEPSIVRLPNQYLFCVMRTNSGYIWYSVSKDDGGTWSHTRPLLRRDFGQPMLQPVSCCPVYHLADGRYVLLHHNRAGDMAASPEATHGPRYPSCLALGEFRPSADQPLWFSASKVFMDTAGINVDGKEGGQTGIGIYTSFTTRKRNNVLWYPDRKHFLLGKRVTPEFLSGLEVPR